MGAVETGRTWTLVAAALMMANVLDMGSAARNGLSDMSVVCSRFPSMQYCKTRPPLSNIGKGGLPQSSNRPAPKSGAKFPQAPNQRGPQLAPGPIPPPLPTPPPIAGPAQPFPGQFPGQPQQPLPTPPPIQQPLPTPPPIQQPQQPLPAPLPPVSQLKPQPPFPAPQPPQPQPALPAPQPALPPQPAAPPPAPAPAPSGGSSSIGQPLGFLGGGGNTAPAVPGPSGGAGLNAGSSTQVGNFAGASRNTAVDPFSGVSSGTSVNAAGLPISSRRGVSFGGLIPGGAGLSNMFGRRRRRRAVADWYVIYLRARLRL